MSGWLARRILGTLGLVIGLITLGGDIRFVQTGGFASGPTLLTGFSVFITLTVVILLLIAGLIFLIFRALED